MEKRFAFKDTHIFATRRRLITTLIVYFLIEQVASDLARCRTVPSSYNAELSPTAIIKRGERVELRCKDNYLPEITHSLCSLSLGLSTPVPECKAITCPYPGYDDNGGFQLRPQGSLVVGSILHYNCTHKYKYTGTVKRECQKNGQWSGRQGECKEIICPAPATPVNGRLSHQGPYGLGANVGVDCDEGYEYDGGEIACMDSSTWSDNLGKCIDIPSIRCNRSDLGNVTNDPDKEIFAFDESVTVSCQTGYKYSSETYRVCLVSGEWSGSPGICMVIFCPTPNTIIPHGRVDKCEKCRYNISLPVFCEQGYSYSGNPPKCGGNGTWQGLNVVCQEASPEPRQLSTVGNVLVIIFSIIVALGLFVLVVVMIKTRPWKKLYKRVPPADAEEGSNMGIIGKGHIVDKDIDQPIDLDREYITLRLISPKDGSRKKSVKENIQPDKYKLHIEKEDPTEIKIEDVIMDKTLDIPIVVTGRAGVGKSTLIQKHFRNWAKGGCIGLHKYAFLLTIRRIQICGDALITQAKLLKQYSEYKTKCNDAVLSGDGEGILVALDGLDEFANLENHLAEGVNISRENKLSAQKWLIRILKRTSLPKCTLVVTSRHFKGLKNLRPYKEIEVIGLTEERIGEFINCHVENEKKKMVDKTIFSNPVLLSVSSITFFCMMLCKTLERRETTSMSNDVSFLTYTRITLFITQRYLTRNKRTSQEESTNILFDLETFTKLAYLGIKDLQGNKEIARLVFSDEDFYKAGIEEHHVKAGRSSGLLVCTDTEDNRMLVEFPHLSIQEVLAMAYLLQQEKEEISSMLRIMWHSGQFDMALIYLFGLAFDDTCGEMFAVRQQEHQETINDHPLLQCFVDILNEGKAINRFQRRQALQLLYESQKPELVHKLAPHFFTTEIAFRDMTLSAVDLNGMIFSICHSQGIKTLSLNRVIMDESCQKILGNFLKKSSKLEVLRINGTLLSKQGLVHILEGVQTNTYLQTLSLESANIGDESVNLLTCILDNNTKLQTINLAYNRFYASGISQLSAGLKRRKTHLTVEVETDVIWDPLKEAIAQGDNTVTIRYNDN